MVRCLGSYLAMETLFHLRLTASLDTLSNPAPAVVGLPNIPPDMTAMRDNIFILRSIFSYNIFLSDNVNFAWERLPSIRNMITKPNNARPQTTPAKIAMIMGTPSISPVAIKMGTRNTMQTR